MHVVINISEQDYELACKYPDVLFGSYGRAIAKGTPLSKGHGDLIDRNELYKDLITNEWITDDDGGGLEDILFDAPTIIGADIEI